jgi:hypothetical protein
MNTEKLRAVTDPAQLEDFRRAHEDGERRRRFWLSHWKELQKLHPDEWVAATDEGTVIAHSPELLYVWGFLEGRGLSPKDTYVEYMDTGRRRFVL